MARPAFSGNFLPMILAHPRDLDELVNCAKTGTFSCDGLAYRPDMIIGPLAHGRMCLVVVNKLDQTLQEDLTSYQNNNYSGWCTGRCARMRIDLSNNSNTVSKYDNIGDIPGKIMIDGVPHYGVGLYTFDVPDENSTMDNIAAMSFQTVVSNDAFGSSPGSSQLSFGVAWNVYTKYGTTKSTPKVAITMQLEQYDHGLQELFEKFVGDFPGAFPAGVTDYISSDVSKSVDGKLIAHAHLLENYSFPDQFFAGMTCVVVIEDIKAAAAEAKLLKEEAELEKTLKNLKPIVKIPSKIGIQT